MRTTEEKDWLEKDNEYWGLMYAHEMRRSDRALSALKTALEENDRLRKRSAEITVGCSVCGDEIEVSEVGTNEDGSTWITVSGVCSRDADSRVEEANHRAHQERMEANRRIENERRESEHRLMTDQFMNRQKNEKAEQDRRWDRMLGRR
jgi:hypothetical protein